MTRIVGLTGPARAGKSIVAETLVGFHPGNTVIRGFADLVKLSAAKSFDVTFHPDDVGTKAVRRWADELKLNMSVQLTDGDGQVVHSISGRRFLQCFGTEAHRELFGETFWIDQMDLDAEGYDLLVIDDVRFEDEAQAILDRGGEIWRIVRHGRVKAGHRSEQPLPEELITHTIANTGTLGELERAVQSSYVMAIAT
jgi:hypothetical protein